MGRPSHTVKSLRRSLFTGLTFLISVSLILFSAGVILFGLRPVVDQVAEIRFKQAVAEIEGSLDRIFSPVDTILYAAQQWLSAGDFDHSQLDEFNRFIWQVLKKSPQLTSAVAGTSDGQGWMMLQQPDGGWISRITNIPQRGQVQHFTRWSADGSKQEYDRVIDYDPRLRPWYRGAVEQLGKSDMFWTAPYTFFTTGEAGVTAASAIALSDGRTLAVGLDMKLLDISRASTAVHVSDHGFVAVIDGNARLLGLPGNSETLTSKQINNLVLRPATALANPALNAGISLWQQRQKPAGAILHFSLSGQPWLASFQRASRGNQTFWIAVLAPSTDFIPPWQPLAQGLLAMFVAVLALSFLLVLRYARQFSRPLEELATESRRIANLDFSHDKTVNSAIREIQQLADAQATMRNMLLDYRNTVDAQATDLTQQITALKDAESRLEKISYHDTLTGLPNRLLLNDRMENVIQRAQRQTATFAVFFLDLDHFKAVNDTHGHPVGDRLLCVAAERFSKIVRKADTLARIGGDEFVILAENIEEEGDAENLAEKLLATLVRPLDVDGRLFHLTGSIGISLYPADGTDRVTLIRNADSAMYQAKASGRNRYHFYSVDITRRVTARLKMEQELHTALAQDEFEVHYQPQVNTVNGALIGVEALVRWRHPTEGLVMPDTFIPVAEDCGLIGRIGEWVLNEACRQWAAWRSQHIQVPRLAVNLSVKQLQDDSLQARITDILARHGLPPGVLEIEVTESIFLENPDAVSMLLAMEETGISFALDDFGTGYSSLGYLKKMPPARLKIDQGFTRDIGQGKDGEVVVLAIIGLATALGREVIAEGVETREQADFMVHHGCHQAQGYFYSKPLSPADFADWYTARNQ